MFNYIKTRDELIHRIDTIDTLSDVIILFEDMKKISESKTPTAGMDAIANSLAYVINIHGSLLYSDPNKFLSLARESLIILDELEDWGKWTDGSVAPSTEILINRVVDIKNK